MPYPGGVKFGQNYWVDRFAPAPSSTTVVQQQGVGTNSRQNFSGTQDGANTVFTLSNSPNASNLEVFKNGLILLSPDDYSLSGNTVTFAAAPHSDDTLVAYYGGVSQRQTVSGVLNSSNKTFTLPSAPTNTSLQFYWNGVLQFEGNDYTLSGNTITMTLAPSSGDSLVAYY